MARHRFAAFIAPRELASLLEEEALKLGAEAICRTENPASLVRVPLSELASFLERDHVPEVFLALPGGGPDHPQDWHFPVRNRSSLVTIEVGRASDAVAPTTFLAEPDGVAMVVLRDLERAVSRHCHKYVRIPQTRKLQRFYWSPALMGRHLLGREAVLDEAARMERAAATLKRKPKWKLREPPPSLATTYRREGKAHHGAGIDDLRVELIRFSAVNRHPADAFFEPRCSCPHGGREGFLVAAADHSATLVCASCGRGQSFGTDATESTLIAMCTCGLEERHGQVMVAGAFFPGSEDVRWLYIGWRAPVCGLLRVAADWPCDGSRQWADIMATHFISSLPR
ncbi:MAG: hypothetical protein JNK04_08165 [Myxococcales bacterium]|nr:hypothetical protein [Myxococcales bacterium]